MSSESLRVCFVGAEQSGKTALITRLLYDEFEVSYAPTLEDNYRHSFVVGYKEHQVDIMDIGGTDIYHSEYNRWFTWADAFVFVYSISEEETFVRLKFFRDEIQRVKKSQGILMRQVPTILVGTHLDVEPRVIAEYMGKKMGEALNCPFYETSSKESITNLKKTESATTPMGVMARLIQLRNEKFSWKVLDELSIPSPTQTQPKTKDSKKPKEPKKKPISLQSADSAPTLSIVEELREKWGRPIDKLPVYIDLPRLASKIVVEVGSSRRPYRNKVAQNLLKSMQGANNHLNFVVPEKGKSKSLPNTPKASPGYTKRSKDYPPSPKSAKMVTGVTKKDGKPDKDDDKKKKKEEKKEKSEKEAKKKEKEDKKREKEEKKKPTKKDSKGKLIEYETEDSEKLSVGARVCIPSQPQLGKGFIRYKGVTKLESGIMIGIELDNPVEGGNNGSVKGVTYFPCLEKRGLFIKPNLVVPLFIKESPDKYTGGTIKSTRGEEWHYSSDGTVTCKDPSDGGREIVYEWDGEYIKAKENHPTFGAGQWNGEQAVWYKKEWMIFRTSKREEFLKYAWDSVGMSYLPIVESTKKPPIELPVWRWKDDVTLAASTSTFEWALEGSKKVPRHVVLFLQMIKYVRYGFEETDSSDKKRQALSLSLTPSMPSSPVMDMTPMSASLSSPSSNSVSSATSHMNIQEISGKLQALANSESVTPRATRSLEDVSSKNNSTINNNNLITSPSEPPPGKIMKLNVRVNNWKFRIPISENASVAYFTNEISRRATKKLQSIANKLEESKVTLEGHLDKLVGVVENGTEEDAKAVAALTRILVDAINDRIEDGNTVAITQTKEVEVQLSQTCEELEHLQKILVRSVITALRNPTTEARKAMLSEVLAVKTASAKISVIQCRIRVMRLQINGADLDVDDKVGDSLENEANVDAIVGRDEAEIKREEELLIKLEKESEEERQRKQNELMNSEKVLLDRQRKEEEEQERKWRDLFVSLEDEQQQITKNLIGNHDIETVLKTALQQQKEQKLDLPIPASSFEDKKSFIGEVMREVMCQISESLGEHQQTEQIKAEFYSFIKKSGTGDTSRQLSKFLQQVLKEDSKLSKVLKAINQSIIATPFIRLKYAFPPSIPFEDCAGTWKIIVNIVPNEEVLVIHQKSGASKDRPPIGGFEFHWELIMRFNWELDTLIEADLVTTGITFEKGIIESNKVAVQDVIDLYKDY